jgi:hypothetical protein
MRDFCSGADNPIGAVLVFLHLLEGEIERIGKRLLVHAQEQATRSDSAAETPFRRAACSVMPPLMTVGLKSRLQPSRKSCEATIVG